MKETASQQNQHGSCESVTQPRTLVSTPVTPCRLVHHYPNSYPIHVRAVWPNLFSKSHLLTVGERYYLLYLRCVKYNRLSQLELYLAKNASISIFMMTGTRPTSALAPSLSTGFSKRCISLTTSANLLILHPDMLLTATALSNAPQCMRKPVLTSLVRSTSDITPALVWGSMLHEVMQRCLLERRWDEAWIDKCLHNAISGGLGELVKLGLSEKKLH